MRMKGIGFEPMKNNIRLVYSQLPLTTWLPFLILLNNDRIWTCNVGAWAQKVAGYLTLQ